MDNRNLIIVGAGQYSKVASEIAESTGFETIAFLDDNASNAIGTLSDMRKYVGDYCYAIVAIGNSKLRRQLLEELEECGYTIATLIHPRAYVSPSAFIMKGCIIEPMVVIQTGAILETGVFASAGSIVNHDCVIGEVCHLDVGSVLKSNSTIPSGTKIEACTV
jgi:UDP-3-O-[3-hydroxymyristoyl] glucosamine N-acyltransferase